MTGIRELIPSVLGVGSTTAGDGDGSTVDGDVRETAVPMKQPDAGGELGARETAAEGMNIRGDALLETLPQPAFVVGTDHRIVGWNGEMEVLTGIDRESVIGDDDAAAIFRDDRDRTLADAVVDSPDRAHETFGAERSGRGQRAYEAEQELENADGETLYVHSVATPIREDGSLRGVVQLLQDNTEVIRRRKAMSDLVGRSADTAEALERGDLSARVEHTEAHGILDDDVLEITEAVNSVADSTERMVKGIAEEVDDVAVATDRITENATEVTGEISEQNGSLRSITSGIQDLSATMEEVAASSDQVASAANRAEEAAVEGAKAGESAREEMAAVVETIDDLVATVEQLESRMDDIDEVTDVIGDIADETNILALNASIEAARADGDGDGFEVVAEEVKALAEETKENATEISERIVGIQEQTRATVENTEATSARARSASDGIEETLDALEEIVDASKEVADGIDEVATVNDDQAASLERISATADEIDARADGIEERAGDVASLTEQQRDDIGDIVEYLDELSAATEASVDGE